LLVEFKKIKKMEESYISIYGIRISLIGKDMVQAIKEERYPINGRLRTDLQL